MEEDQPKQQNRFEDEEYLDEEDGELLNEDDVIEVYDLDDDEEGVEGGEGEGEGEGGEGEGVTMEDAEEGNKDSDAVGGFFEHTDSVYSVSINSVFSEIVLTGGGDDRAFVWNRLNGTKLHELSGHTDTVLATGFNFNGELCATGSMDGTVKVWEVKTGKLVSTLEGPQDGIEWLQWHSKGSVLLAGSTDGTAWLWASSGQCMSVFTGHRGPVTCGQFTPDGKKVVTGSDDGSVRVWTPKAATSEVLIAGHSFHDGPVTSLACHNTIQHLLITGSQDRTARICNITNGKVLGSLMGHTDSVESVGFSDPSSGGLTNFAATGSVDAAVKVWDINTCQLRTTFHHDDAVTKIQWRGSLLYSASADKTIRVWDARQSTPVKVLRGHDELVLNFTVTPDGAHLISVSDDHSALIFPL